MADAAMADRVARFRAGYAQQRAAEGRGAGGVEELLALPYLARGPLARQWAVRARSFDAFVTRVLEPLARQRGGGLSVLDLGAGNGWLCYRVAGLGCRALALDLRDDAVDGLGAGALYADLEPGVVGRVVASFEELPLRSASFDVAVFNAAIHYALDLGRVLEEAVRVVRPGGRVVILDSPFYTTESAGHAMVAEKRRQGAARFGERADDLLALPFVEFLTPGRLEAAHTGLEWRRQRVRYPFAYELRPLAAWLRRRRPPSRFDLWEATVA